MPFLGFCTLSSGSRYLFWGRIDMEPGLQFEIIGGLKSLGLPQKQNNLETTFHMKIHNFQGCFPSQKIKSGSFAKGSRLCCITISFQSWEPLVRHGGKSSFIFLLFCRYLLVFCSRERLRRVLRKKHLHNYPLIYIFTSSHLHIFTSAHLHLHFFTSTHLHLRIFTSAHLHPHICSSISSHLHLCSSARLLLCSSAHLHIYIFAHLHIFTSHICSSSRSSSNFLLRWGGAARATLCGGRACRRREMQVRLHFCPVQRNPLRRSCVSKARNAGDITFLNAWKVVRANGSYS